MFTCGGRTHRFFGESAFDATTFTKVFENVPLIGMYAGGESTCTLSRMLSHTLSRVWWRLRGGRVGCGEAAHPCLAPCSH